MSKDTGGAAFPENQHHIAGHKGGMTLRDYFAGQAMNGLASDDASMARLTEVAEKSGADVIDYLASASYEVADAMLAERNK